MRGPRELAEELLAQVAGESDAEDAAIARAAKVLRDRAEREERDQGDGKVLKLGG